MPWSYSPETMAQVQGHVEGSTLPYAEIAKLTRVSATSVSRWKCRYGWQRPPGAFERRPIPKDRCAAAKRAMEDGARYQEVAVLLDRSPDIVRRLRRPSPGAKLAAAPGDADGADPLELVPELIDALTVRGLARDDVLRHAPGIFGVLCAQLLRGDADAPRRTEAFARAAAIFIKMPDPFGPADGAPHDDPYAGPQTFDETNALLEELAQRLEEFAARGDDEAVPGEALADADALPQ